MISRQLALSAAFVVTLLASSGAAEEDSVRQPVEEFGKAGVLNIASDLSLSVQKTSYSAPSGEQGPPSIWAYSIGPAADFFPIDNLSVGALVLFEREAITNGTTANKIQVSPRIGYHISLIPERLGLWPRVEIGYATTTFKSPGAAESTEKVVPLGVFVPLVIHPVEHFHIGIGPFFETDLSAKEDDHDGIKATTFGIRTEIAGWWKL